MASIGTPQPTVFATDYRAYYFAENPWKVCGSNDYQKVFRRCVACWNDRFTDEAWASVHTRYVLGTPMMCDKPSCMAEIEHLSGYVPRSYLFVETAEDKDHVRSARDKEAYVATKPVVRVIRHDTIYSDAASIPPAAKDEIAELEKLPIEARIMEMTSRILKFRERHSIPFEQTDSLPPYLQELERYRDLCSRKLYSYKEKGIPLRTFV